MLTFKISDWSQRKQQMDPQVRTNVAEKGFFQKSICEEKIEEFRIRKVENAIS